jgi:hypothetical protein
MFSTLFCYISLTSGTKFNGTNQLLVCVKDVNPLKDNVNNIIINTEALIGVSKEAGLDMGAEKST